MKHLINNIFLVGWKCCRSGCSAEYTGPEKNAEFCYYHPGAPVFHEGMKFWSCCERKTSDFTSFLNQVGCEKAESHQWVHPDEGERFINLLFFIQFTKNFFFDIIS